MRLFILCGSFLLAVSGCSASGPALQLPPTTAPPVAEHEQHASPDPERGKALAAEHACSACHSQDGNPSVGPTWKGLFGKEEVLAGGAKVRVDEAYLNESIVAPNAKVVEGFRAGIMPPDFGQKLSEGDIQAIIAFIKSLA